MTSRTEYPGMAEILAAHAGKREYERYLFASRFIFRPPSFPAVWLLVRLGVTSEAASWLSGLFALAGLVCLLLPEPLMWPAAGFLCLFNFFDCLDGNIARVMRTRNPYGRFLDSIMWWADMLFWAALGVAVWRAPELRLLGDVLDVPEAFWAAVGGAISFLASYAAYLDGVFDLTLREHWEHLQRSAGVPAAATPLQGKSGPEFFFRVLAHNLRVRETHYLLLAAAIATGAVDVMLAAFLLYYAALAFSLLVVYCRRGRAVFRSGLGRDVTG